MAENGIHMGSLRSITVVQKNPLGTVMSARRRQELLKWLEESEEHYIIEDGLGRAFDSGAFGGKAGVLFICSGSLRIEWCYRQGTLCELGKLFFRIPSLEQQHWPLSAIGTGRKVMSARRSTHLLVKLHTELKLKWLEVLKCMEEERMQEQHYEIIKKQRGKEDDYAKGLQIRKII